MSTTHDDSEIIDRLGGASKVAAICRIRPQAVSQWRRYGIPAARRDFLQLLRPDAFASGQADAACAAAANSEQA